MHLIHFQSRDLSVLHRQGRFWHCFLTGGAVIVSQDEDNTWTLHTPTAPETNVSSLDPHEVISRSISGSFDVKVPIKIDKILVSSTWRPSIFLSSRYTSPHQRVFLAGDSAHQTVPAGGYGMNTAVGDSFDIGWKLSAVLKGHAGEKLLNSYEAERRPVASRNLEQARKNWQAHGEAIAIALEVGSVIHEQSPAGRAFRERLEKHIKTSDMENPAVGLELDYRYRNSPVIVRDDEDVEPAWDKSGYTPSTWPGARIPSVRLKDGKRNIYELLGQGSELTIVDFTADARYAQAFEAGSQEFGIPLRVVHLPDEDHVRGVWERDAVLVRPDDHVAWRSGCGAERELGSLACVVLSTVLGREE